MTSSQSIYKQLGLNEAEGRVYELLVQFGGKTGAEMAKLSKLGRVHVYNALLSLVKKGLVVEREGKKTLYEAENPDVLRALGEQKLAQTQGLLQQLDGLLVGLRAQHSLVTRKPVVRFFLGEEGVKELHLLLLEQKETLYGFVGEEPSASLVTWFRGEYLKKRLKAGVATYGIVSGETKITDVLLAKQKAELRTAVYVPQEELPIDGELLVSGKCVALFDFQAEEPLGLLIQSSALANTLREVVKLLVRVYSGR